jgi:Ca2+-binding RTX toxin-like protein
MAFCMELQMAKPRPTSSYRVVGTDGNDSLKVPAGATLFNTTFDGGKGSDTLDLSAFSSAGVYVRVEPGYTQQTSSVADRPFTGTFGGTNVFNVPIISGSIKNIENLIGTAGDDFLYVQSNGPIAKRVDGGPGDDVVHSLGGNARLIGGTGSDWLVSYWENNVLIGGLDDNLPGSDGQRDFFWLASAPTILDYEVGVDRMVLESVIGSIDVIYNGVEWRAEGNGSSLWINGVREVTLANVSVEEARTTSFGLVLSPVNNVVQGGPNDDILYVGGATTTTRVLIAANSGDDVLKNFDLPLDGLVFADGLEIVWSNSVVNGLNALVGTFQGGSVTIERLSMNDVAALQIEGPRGTLSATINPIASAWSNSDDVPSPSLSVLAPTFDGQWWA